MVSSRWPRFRDSLMPLSAQRCSRLLNGIRSGTSANTKQGPLPAESAQLRTARIPAIVNWAHAAVAVRTRSREVFVLVVENERMGGGCHRRESSKKPIRKHGQERVPFVEWMSIRNVDGLGRERHGLVLDEVAVCEDSSTACNHTRKPGVGVEVVSRHLMVWGNRQADPIPKPCRSGVRRPSNKPRGSTKMG
ncbi:hypothetical protein N657DRAFT_302787 [Parathielavia appendiculata]|uniref:Uncharacterized protein n=1 Tax=Parathielavia appendiculata TaxID=2587402 RepID=A0AAN6Z6S5_9PEZI|nr:hypothetical protein N657DRAFT_302787 [Parathielavia appendiculata]